MEPWAVALQVLKLRFTEEEIAGKLKVARNSVNRWSRGERRPHPKHRRKLESMAARYPEVTTP